MQSLRYLYRIGNGPSSSHTMGPMAAAKRMLDSHPEAVGYTVTLFGSLAKTGHGHMTDKAVLDVLGEDRTRVIFDTESEPPCHPNTLEITAHLADGEDIKERYLSIGGGELILEGEESEEHYDIYPHDSYTEISEYCRERDMRLYDYVEECEGKEIWEYLDRVLSVMEDAVKRGINQDGILPGGLHLERKAKYLHRHRHIDESEETRTNRLICAYAYAVSEENSAGGLIVTAPTCGACGVVPAVLHYLGEKKKYTRENMLHALATAGIIGNLIKKNASISGAECGCQAEIGTASAMAAAAAAELSCLDLDQIEHAAEMSVEHHLGLTCDPVGGLVQIPCIERNAIAAMRALNAVNLAGFLAHSRRIRFDTVVETMYETGKDLKVIYRETAEGGLAKKYKAKD